MFRASVFALVAGYLAALGHMLGGGHLPDPAVLLTVAVFIGGSVSGLAVRRRTGPQIFTVLVASQFVFHLMFALTAHHPAPIDLGRMLVFHFCAAFAAAALMAGGESTLFRLFWALSRALSPSRPRQCVGVALRWTALIFAEVGHRRMRAVELSLNARRGPPKS